MKEIAVKSSQEVPANTEAFSCEEFSITELEDRLEFLARSDIASSKPK
jgi:hypothetical protein